MDPLTNAAEEPTTKYCPGCDKTKPLTDFHRDRTHKDGYKSNCKICRSGKSPESESSEALGVARGKTREELETLARAKAIRRLIENHNPELQSLLRRYRRELGLGAHWESVS